jgi:hypothetical protein
MSGMNITVQASVSGRYTNSDQVGSLNDSLNIQPAIAFASGSGYSEGDAVYEQALNIAGNTTQALDLSSLTDPLGQALTLARVKAIVITGDATNAADITIGAAASNGFIGPFDAASGKVHTQAGGMTILATPQAAGWPVTASTAHLVSLGNPTVGNAVTGKLVIIGSRE